MCLFTGSQLALNIRRTSCLHLLYGGPPATRRQQLAPIHPQAKGERGIDVIRHLLLQDHVSSHPQPVIRYLPREWMLQLDVDINNATSRGHQTHTDTDTGWRSQSR